MTRTQLLRWLPAALVGLYVVLVIVHLPTILSDMWWVADSATGPVLAGLYHQPPAGQYVILGDHGWFEELLFYILARSLPAHHALWYVAPVCFWVVVIALVVAAAVRTFDRVAGALVAGALLCIGPDGLIAIFQPTAHTNSLLHAAVLGLVAVWVLPRVRSIATARLVAIAALLGLFSGLAVTGDIISLVWGPLPFAVAVAVCAWRGAAQDARKTVLFGLVTLAGVLVGEHIIAVIVHGMGLRIDEIALNATQRFAQPDAILPQSVTAFSYAAFLMGGAFFGSTLGLVSELQLLIAALLAVAIVAVFYAVRRAVLACGTRPDEGASEPVDARLVYVSFWLTVLVAGVLMFVIGNPPAGVWRYLLGPLVAVIALLPFVAQRAARFKLAVSAGIAIVALAASLQILDQGVVTLPNVPPRLSARVVDGVEAFAALWRTHFGFSAYWDSMTLTWMTNFRVHLYEVERCGNRISQYCPELQSTFTSVYTPQAGRRTLFIADPALDFTEPDRAWGKPIAHKRIGRLEVYVYNHDIASGLLAPHPDLQVTLSGAGSRNRASP